MTDHFDHGAFDHVVIAQHISVVADCFLELSEEVPLSVIDEAGEENEEDQEDEGEDEDVEASEEEDEAEEGDNQGQVEHANYHLHSSDCCEALDFVEVVDETFDQRLRVGHIHIHSFVLFHVLFVFFFKNYHVRQAVVLRINHY